VVERGTKSFLKIGAQKGHTLEDGSSIFHRKLLIFMVVREGLEASTSALWARPTCEKQGFLSPKTDLNPPHQA
jgi:hypothetical protein